jgi:hypothetical protein
MIMARCKKTFEVESFKEYVNNQLTRTDEYATDAFKSGLCLALEEVLHKTGNYKGFNDLYWNEIGFKEWLASGETEIWEEKKKYIYGTLDSKYRGSKYSRMYY